MQIPPPYEITPEILELISKIEALNFFFSSFEIPLERKEKIKRASILKSSLFSAKIEGNSLLLEEVERTSKEKEKREIFNILDAIKYLEKLEAGKITNKQILTLHELVMKDLSENGHFRKSAEAIFNEAGIAVALFPPAIEIKGLMDELLNYINSDKEKFILIKAFIGHLVFEKIHPFADGNGRVGRLLINLILKTGDSDFSLIVPFTEYIEKHKEEYYFYLDEGQKNPKDYLLFMLRGFYEKAEELRLQLLIKDSDNLLPPRQEEILAIIKEHQTVTFDFLSRRFLAVPGRTLRYDLKKLLEKGFIVKIGKTNKSYYRYKLN